MKITYNEEKGDERMFSKHTIDYDLFIKQQLKSIAVLDAQAESEEDPFIKASLLAVIIEKYDECIDGIRHGANYNAYHFANLKRDYEKALKELSR